MTKISYFEGQFKKVGGSYIKKLPKGVLKLIIAQRKQVTRSKTKQFILFSNGVSRPQYWSSLYPTSTNEVYEAEYQGTFYVVEIYKSGLEIRERSVA